MTATRSSELAVRTLAGAVMIAVALAALILGGIVFWLLLVVVALVMMAEWADLQKVPLRHKRLAQYALSVPLALTAPASLILQIHDFFTLGCSRGRRSSW